MNPSQACLQAPSLGYMAEESRSERKFVVDTNVLAYYALNTVPFREEAAALFSKPFELLAPDSWREALVCADEYN